MASRQGYTIADYLLDRLAELGVDTVFGVPGDFTLGFLDHVDEHPALTWVGTANELGAGYAADGYARVRGLGVVCTTFGVGELSAINAVAGAYAEHVPLLHLVGSPTEAVQRAGRPTHHSLGDGDFLHTLRMTAEVTVAQSMLTAATACTEIDRVLSNIVALGQPGYLSLPADVAEASTTPPSSPLAVVAARSDTATLHEFAAAAAQLITDRPPVVLADIFVHRAGAQPELHELIDRGGLQYASLLWGRRVIDESGPGYLGLYLGAASSPSVRDAIESAPTLITAGVYFTDLISGFFSHHLDPSRRIDVQPHTAVVGGIVFTDIEMRDALSILTDLVPTATTSPAAIPRSAPPTFVTPSGRSLSQEQLWTTVSRALTSNDVVLADQGTSFYGMAGHTLPHAALFIGQPLWASIGYTLPALLGASLAEPTRRPVLLIGDGAAQLTIGELGTIIRLRLSAVIIVVNNNGYTVERAIHGADKGYNDIATWRWTAIPAALGADPDHVRAVRVHTAEALESEMTDAAEHADRLTFIEVVTAETDVPPVLQAVAAAAAGANTSTPSVPSVD